MTDSNNTVVSNLLHNFHNLLPRGSRQDLLRNFNRLLSTDLDALSNWTDLNQLRSYVSELTFPHTDLHENRANFVVEINTPGFEKKDLSLHIDEKANTLTVSGTRSENKNTERKDDDVVFHQSERYAGSFSRTIHFPKDVRNDGVHASYNNGVLCVIVPKSDDPRPDGKIVIE